MQLYSQTVYLHFNIKLICRCGTELPHSILKRGDQSQTSIMMKLNRYRFVAVILVLKENNSRRDSIWYHRTLLNKLDDLSPFCGQVEMRPWSTMGYRAKGLLFIIIIIIIIITNNTLFKYCTYQTIKKYKNKFHIKDFPTFRKLKNHLFRHYEDGYSHFYMSS